MTRPGRAVRHRVAALYTTHLDVTSKGPGMASGAMPGQSVLVRVSFAGMAIERMNREDFYARLAALDEERLKKALWNLYWRGAAPVRPNRSRDRPVRAGSTGPGQDGGTRSGARPRRGRRVRRPGARWVLHGGRPERLPQGALAVAGHLQGPRRRCPGRVGGAGSGSGRRGAGADRRSGLRDE